MIVARSVWFESAGVVRVREEALGDPGPGEVRVRAICSGISAGTERLVLSGAVPEEARAIMALPLMRGGFELPIAYGYALVGVVEATGERVFLLHPHQDRLNAPASALRSLPEGVPSERLVLAPSVETAINVIWDAEIGLGDRVVVTGLGVIGLLVVRLAARAGAASIAAVDPDPARRALALALGATRASEVIDPAQASRADALIEVSGSTAALASLVEHAGPEARVVVASWYGSRPAALPLGGRFHPHRVTIRGSQVARIDPRRSGRWDGARRWSLVEDLLRDGELDRLLAGSVPLSSAPVLYAELTAGVRWSPPQRVLDAAR